MTPLAQAILRDAMLPMSARSFRRGTNVDVQKEIRSAHCFEVSEVMDLIQDLSEKTHTKGIDGEYYTGHFPVDELTAFLPAEKTWIEWRYDEEGKKGRNGILLLYAKDFILCTYVTDRPRIGGIISFSVPQHGSGMVGQLRFDTKSVLSQSAQLSIQLNVYSALAVINTPRVIGRRQHMPHRGLERQLAKNLGILGRFPLQAWTEIKLEVSTLNCAGEEYEAHLTGQKALHFCRAHIRIRLGRLEIVRGHWRGDSSLGIKRSRYVLTKPNAQGTLP